MKGNTETYTLITGASNGLGKEFACEFAKRGNNLILVSLPGEDLDKYCKELEQRYDIKASYFETDLTKEGSPAELADWVKDHFSVNILVNNAGVGGSRHFEESSVEYLDRIIMLNIRALTLITRLMLTELRKHNPSYILNVASIAAYSPIPFKTVYPASKAFVYSFSRSLNVELRGSPVKITVLSPGPIMTNSDATERIKKMGFYGKFGLLSANRIAQISISSMFKGKKVIIPGILNKVNYCLLRVVPLRIRLYVLSRLFRKDIIQP
jgi:short-subunit dehydrogenase